MGKMIKSASRWTSKSTLLLLNKVVTIIFGVFCIVTGQTKSFRQTVLDSGTVDYGITPLDTYNFSGKVISSKTQAVIEGIKVILKSEIEDIIIKYGMINPIETTVKVDSVYTDENGEFKISTMGETGLQPNWILETIDVDSSINGTFESKEIVIGKLSMTDMLSGNVGDTVVTIALDPIEVNINGIKSTGIDNKIIKLFSGKNVIFHISNFKNKGAIAKIIDIKGRLIEQIEITSSGTFKLNSKQVSSGTYFVNIEVDGVRFSTQVTIQ